VGVEAAKLGKITRK